MTTKKENAKCLFLFANENKEAWVNLLDFEAKSELQEFLRQNDLEGAEIKQYERQFESFDREKCYTQRSLSESLQEMYESKEDDFDNFLNFLQEKIKYEDDLDYIIALIANFCLDSFSEIKKSVQLYTFQGEYKELSDFVKNNEFIRTRYEESDEDESFDESIDEIVERTFFSNEDSFYFFIRKIEKDNKTNLIYCCQ